MKRQPVDFTHVVIAQKSNGQTAVFGPFDTAEAAESFAEEANRWPQDAHQYTAIYMFKPEQHHSQIYKELHPNTPLTDHLTEHHEHRGSRR